MSGDHVRLESQERLDLEDARALQDLVYAYASRALGDVLGAGSGCVSPFQYEHDDDGAEFWINLQGFAFYHSKGDQTRQEPTGIGQPEASVFSTWRGGVVTFDPTKQSAKVDYTTARNAARAYATGHGGDTPPEGTANALPWLWARPIWVDEDEDARRKWSMDLKTEVPVTINTRERQRVEFVFADSLPDPGLGEPFVKIGKVTSWAFLAGAPNHANVSRISMWDSQALLDWTGETDSLFDTEEFGRTSAVGMLHGKNLLGAADGTNLLGAYPDDHRDLGLIRIFWLLRNRFRRAVSYGTADPAGTTQKGWLHIPKYSLRGLARLIDNTITPAINILLARPTAWKAILRVSITRDLTPPYAVTSVMWRGEGIESVELKRAEADTAPGDDGYFIVTFTDGVLTEASNLGTGEWSVSVHPVTSQDVIEGVITHFEPEGFRIAESRVIGPRKVRIVTERLYTEPVGTGYVENIGDEDFVAPFARKFWTSFYLELRGPINSEFNDITP
jgi:hypothetical protein